MISTDIWAVLVSVGTTLGIPAAYFSILRYPDAFNEKVGAMSIFHETRVAHNLDATRILARTKEATDVLLACYGLSTGDPKFDGQTKDGLFDSLRVSLAELRSCRGANSLTDNLVAVAEEKVQDTANGIEANWLLDSQNSRRIEIDLQALAGSFELYRRESETQKTLYSAEMETRQASIDVLNKTLNIAMFGLKTYLTTVAVWLGYSLHSNGCRWRVAIAVAAGGFILAMSVLTWVANDSVKSPRKLLSRLKEINAGKEINA